MGLVLLTAIVQVQLISETVIRPHEVVSEAMRMPTILSSIFALG